MNFSKDQIIQFLKDKGQPSQVDQAASELPDQVDSDADSGLPAKFGIQPEELPSKLGGSLGNLL